MNEAEKCQRVVILNEGKLLFEGPPADLGTPFEEAFIDKLNIKKEVKVAPACPETKGGEVVAENLVKQFDSFTAVGGVSFTVKPGEIFGFLGPNGAGKSTTFKMLCGLLTPTSGKARVFGQDPMKNRSHIGYMAQKFSLYGNLTVRQNLEFFAGVYSTKLGETLKLFDLEEFEHTQSDSLSAGVKQRLALAAALIHWPQVLFLDEPTSGMDPVSRRHFWSEMKGLAKKGRTILVSTHFMDEAENCDRIALIYKGLIIRLDTPTKLKAEYGSLEEAFVQLCGS